jgi:uncharacterized protein (TIGR03067 family)
VRSSFIGFVVAVLFTVIATIATADDAKEEAIKKDRKQIKGTWRGVALVVNGEKFTENDAKALTVVNGADGAWSICDKEDEKSKGTSTVDPTKNPKAIDITPSIGGDKGMRYLGIYELGENSRKVCIAQPGKDRPTEFSSTPGSGHILVTFERVKTK